MPADLAAARPAGPPPTPAGLAAARPAGHPTIPRGSLAGGSRYYLPDPDFPFPSSGLFPVPLNVAVSALLRPRLTWRLRLAAACVDAGGCSAPDAAPDKPPGSLNLARSISGRCCDLGVAVLALTLVLVTTVFNLILGL